MNDLSLIPINELADELVKRGSVGIVFIADMGPDKLAYVNWVGDYYTALGLCSEMEEKIKGDRRDG